MLPTGAEGAPAPKLNDVGALKLKGCGVAPKTAPGAATDDGALEKAKPPVDPVEVADVCNGLLAGGAPNANDGAADEPKLENEDADVVGAPNVAREPNAGIEPAVPNETTGGAKVRGGLAAPKPNGALADVVVVVAAPADGKVKPDEEDDDADPKPLPKSDGAVVAAAAFVVVAVADKDGADGKPDPNGNPTLLGAVGKGLLLNVDADVAGAAEKLNGFDMKDTAAVDVTAVLMGGGAVDAANAVKEGAEELVPNANGSGLSDAAVEVMEGIDVAVAGDAVDVVVRGLANDPKTIGTEILGADTDVVVEAAGVAMPLADAAAAPNDGNVEVPLVPVEKGFNVADVAVMPKAGVAAEEGNAGNKEAVVTTGGAVMVLSFVLVGNDTNGVIPNEGVMLLVVPNEGMVLVAPKEGVALIVPNEGVVLATANDGAVVLAAGIENGFSFVEVGSENVTVGAVVIGADATVLVVGIDMSVLVLDVATTGSSTIIAGSLMDVVGFSTIGADSMVLSRL